MANEETGVVLTNNNDGDHNKHCKMPDQSIQQLPTKL